MERRIGVGNVKRLPNHSIKNAYFVNWLIYSLLSVLQIYNKGNEVKFLSDGYIMENLRSGEVILTAKRCKNMYVVVLGLVSGDELIYLSAQSDNTNLWHHKLSHMSSSLLNKLVSKDLVHRIPKIKISKDKICDACSKEK